MAESAVLTEKLLAYAGELQSATTFTELIQITLRACTRMGYPHAWLFIAPEEAPGTWKLVEVAGAHTATAWSTAPVLKVTGDAMLEAIEAATEPLVSLDARTDPRTNKRFVKAMGICTIIHVPLRILDRSFGAFGTGTFVDEGVICPTAEQLVELAGMGRQLSLAAGRVRYLDEVERSKTNASQIEVRRRMFASIPRWFSSRVPELQNLLDTIVTTLGAEMADGVVLQLVENERQTLALAAVYEVDPARAALGASLLHSRPIRMGVGLSGRVLVTQAAVLMAHVDTGKLHAEIPSELQVLVDAATASLLAVPMMARGEVIGVLILRRGAQRPAFTMADQQLVQDFADRAALAVENAQLFAQLESRVAERTRELAAANRELEAFSYSVAHDLRSPLRAMGHFATALREDYGDRLDDVALDYLARIARGGEQMNAIIEALLSLARLTKKEIVRERVDLAAIAQAVIGPLRDESPGRTVEVVVAPHLSGNGDAQLLRALFDNLLSNAWKFTRHREGARIEVGSELHGNERIFFVRDNGAGFDANFVSKLFAPFQRLHTAHEFEGSGIGLATAHKIIARHGGRIWAEGAVDQGATLRFTLP